MERGCEREMEVRMEIAQIEIQRTGEEGKVGWREQGDGRGKKLGSGEQRKKKKGKKHHSIVLRM